MASKCLLKAAFFGSDVEKLDILKFFLNIFLEIEDFSKLFGKMPP